MWGNDIEKLNKLNTIRYGHFKLTSGKCSNTYIEKFRILENPAVVSMLCKEIADYINNDMLPDDKPDIIAGPTTGGALVAQEVARQIGAKLFISEIDKNGNRHFGRGYKFERTAKGKHPNVMIVDDVVTTGGTLYEVSHAAWCAGGNPVGFAALVFRANKEISYNDDFIFAPLKIEADAWDSEECELCREKVPIEIT